MSVAVATTYTLWCDGPHCRMFIRGTTSRAAVRRSAEKRGWRINVDKWHRTGGNDYCPEHWERHSEEGLAALSRRDSEP